jgi:hypothetical protein
VKVSVGVSVGGAGVNVAVGSAVAVDVSVGGIDFTAAVLPGRLQEERINMPIINKPVSLKKVVRMIPLE